MPVFLYQIDLLLLCVQPGAGTGEAMVTSCIAVNLLSLWSSANAAMRAENPVPSTRLVGGQPRRELSTCIHWLTYESSDSVRRVTEGCWHTK